MKGNVMRRIDDSVFNVNKSPFIRSSTNLPFSLSSHSFWFFSRICLLEPPQKGFKPPRASITGPCLAPDARAERSSCKGVFTYPCAAGCDRTGLSSRFHFTKGPGQIVPRSLGSLTRLARLTLFARSLAPSALE